MSLDWESHTSNCQITCKCKPGQSKGPDGLKIHLTLMQYLWGLWSFDQCKFANTSSHNASLPNQVCQPCKFTNYELFKLRTINEWVLSLTKGNMPRRVRKGKTCFRGLVESGIRLAEGWDRWSRNMPRRVRQGETCFGRLVGSGLIRLG